MQENGLKSIVLVSTAWMVLTGGLEAERASALQLREAYPLLVPIPDEKVPRLPVPDRSALRRRFAHASPDELVLPRDGARRPSPQRLLRLDLFDGVAVEARFLKLETHGESSFTWFGRVPGEDVGDVILTVVDGVMMGTIHLGTSSYHLRALERDLFEIFEVDVASFGPPHGKLELVSGDTNDLDAVDILEQQPRRLTWRRAALARRNFRKLERPFTYEEVGPRKDRMITDSGGRIDLLIAYTREAANAASSLVGYDGQPIPTATDIHTAIQHTVDRSNLVLGLSGVPTALNLAGTVLVEDPEPATDSETMLGYISDHTDGKFDELLALGDQYHADITSLFVSDFPDACGRGRVLPDLVAPEDQSYTSQGRGQRSAFGKNVVAVRCAVLNDTFVHEFGHNAGLRHDHYVNTKPPAVPGGHGFVLVPPRVRTVMAYDDLCTDFFPDEIPQQPPIAVCKRIPRFSEALATYQGWPLGLTGSSFVKPVNAVDALTAALWTVANFRHSLIGP